jgi:hypothetical protein
MFLANYYWQLCSFLATAKICAQLAQWWLLGPLACHGTRLAFESHYQFVGSGTLATVEWYRVT